MAIILTERATIGAAIEVTKGTPVAPLVGDTGIEVFDPSLEPTVEIAERNPVQASFDMRENIVGNQSYTLTFRTPLKGSGAAGTVTEISTLLQGCGLGETINVSTSVVYDPISAETAQDTLTIDLSIDGKVWRLSGAMGNVKFIMAQNEVPIAEFTFVGVYNAATDTGLLAPTYGTISPPNPVGTACTWNGNTFIGTTVELDLQNDIQLRPDICASTGFLHAYLAGRDPQISIDPEEELVATVDWLAEMISATAGAFAFTLGATAGNIWAFSAPNAQIRGLSFADREGLLIANLLLGARANTAAGDDSVQVTLT